ncbi:LysR substrate-binding domain-containing protein [Cupriavidus basilensis]|uniref:LysR substrate-binding domain-containing protein n=1 Tax=Cupriavidus basilensis TaxID=68895 RepID=A0ABT6AKR7_9BURK|nr:LysR substrate-binding domain-containing protein [Cupriavidus basilensis]MDF3833185.1 LysR substrate-binding domain-containing protein [Cupriavidus basilensis]
MEIRQLEAFAAVMTSGSITAAGRLLGRSQPAITRLIQELESEIGFALFARSGPRVSPTERGFLLYEEVEHALVGLQQIRARAAEIAREENRSLQVAATPALAAGLLPLALAGKQPDHATAGTAGSGHASHIHINSASPEKVVHSVLTGAAEIGLTSLPLEHRGVTVHWIGQAACVAAVRADDPLAARATIPLAACSGRRIVTMQNPYRLRRRLDEAFARAGVEPAALIDTNSSLNALTAVRAGLGIAVLEPVTARGVPLADIVVRPIDADIPFYFGVITPQSRPASAAVLALIDTLAAAARALLPDFTQRGPEQHGALLQALYGDATATEPAGAPLDTDDTDL